MSMQDPIADMLTRIRNAQMVKKQFVEMPSSKLKIGIAKVLMEEGYIVGYEVSQDAKPTLTIELKYYKREAVIQDIKRISKPGCRRYADKKSMPEVMNGLGVAVISTNRGVMTARQAVQNNCGGEIICTVA